MSLFEESYSLMPLSNWFPLTSAFISQYIKDILNHLLEGTGYTFSSDRELGEYFFEKDGIKVPFPALSDGYRAYIGWIGDLLYHIYLLWDMSKHGIEGFITD